MLGFEVEKSLCLRRNSFADVLLDDLSYRLSHAAARRSDDSTRSYLRDKIAVTAPKYRRLSTQVPA